MTVWHPPSSKKILHLQNLFLSDRTVSILSDKKRRSAVDAHSAHRQSAIADNHCLAASHSARVCARAHTFYPIGSFLSFSPDKQKIPQRLRYFQSPWGMFVSYIFKIRCLISSFVYRTEQFHFFFNRSFDSFETRS